MTSEEYIAAIKAKLDSIEASSPEQNLLIRNVWKAMGKPSIYQAFLSLLTMVYSNFPNLPISEMEKIIDELDIHSIEATTYSIATSRYTLEELQELLSIFANPLYRKFYADIPNQEADFVSLRNMQNNTLQAAIDNNIDNWRINGYI